MKDQSISGAGTHDRPESLKAAVADAAEVPFQSIDESPDEMDTEALIEENRRLQEKVLLLEMDLEKRERKHREVKELVPYQTELIRLQQCLERRGKKMIVVFEGRGAAGKGGTIRRVVQYMNAKHYRVVSLGKPTAEERSQWYYQRFVQEFPRAGEMVLFDRSWYSRAIIEPIFGFCSDQEYEDFIKGVSGFELDLIRQDIILVKLYFSVTPEEQARRFEQRSRDPLQHWKLSEVDLDAEEHRGEFTAAKYEMLRHTHSIYSPWTIIRSDIKHQARLNAMKVILSAADYEMHDPTLDITPDPLVAVSGAYELERMKAEQLRQGRF